MNISELESKALWVRRKVLEMAVRADSGHVSTAMSQTEILVALYYGGILKHDPKNPQWDGRDIFILSKGQGGIGLYPILADRGFFPMEDLDNFTGPGSKIGVHAESHCIGVEILSGSLGHGLPIATGYCQALINDGKDSSDVFCLVGDGELQEGSNWEALMWAAHHALDNLVVIVDRNGQNTLGRTDGNTPRDGPGLEFLYKKMEAFGCFVRVVDGHSFFDLSAALRSRPLGKPLVVIANTKKGKGLSAIEDQREWHYKVPRGDVLTKCWDDLKVPAEARPVQSEGQRQHDKGMRDRYFDVLYEYFKKDKNNVIVVADNGAASLDKFATDLPGQYFQVGIAEQQMVGLATGLAKMGKRVWCYAIAPFVTTRVHEFLKLDCCAMNLPICMVGVGAGYAYSIMGPTHHTVEDIAIMRCLPNMQIYSPCDGVTAELIGHITAEMTGPCYVRLDRGGVPDIYKDTPLRSRGMSCVKANESTLTSVPVIISTGIMTHQALKVAEQVDVEILDVFCLKPFNWIFLHDYLYANNGVITLEEHQLAGGLGSIVADFIACGMKEKIPLLRIGVPDKFTFRLGGREEIWKEHGLDVDSIVRRIQEWKRSWSPAQADTLVRS